MKTAPLLAAVVCFLLVSAVGAISARADVPYLGPIPVQYVNPGEELVLDMHRFYSTGGEPSLGINVSRDYTARFDYATFELRVKPARTKPGLVDVQLIAVVNARDTLRSVLTVVVRPRATHLFRYAPGKPAGKVSVAGDFNGWNPDATPLKQQDGDRAYQAEVSLTGGKIGYDLVVDGRWITDPNVPETEADERHGEHSVLTFTPEQSYDAPSIYADRWNGNTLEVKVIPGKAPLANVSAVFERAEGIYSPYNKKVEIEGDTVRIYDDAHSKPGKSGEFVRVIAADENGNVSNVIRVPLGEEKTFRWQDAVMYYALTDRFADGDTANDQPVANPDVIWPANYHGGDLRGIRQKIEEGYFEKLGVNTIWVAPLNRNPERAYREYPEPHRWYTGYHGYWPVSATEVDPHFGDAAELKALVKAAHAHGIKVVADLVLHHVHEDHPWWKEHPDWFGKLELPDGRKNLRLWDEQQFTTWFEPFLPSFDFAKEAPTQALIDNTVWWAEEFDLDGFRLDAVKHILPQFWYKFRAALRERVDAKRGRPLYLVGETFKDREGIAGFVGPNMLDGQFDFPLYDAIKDVFALGKGDVRTLEHARNESDRIYGKEAIMSPLIGNHDKARFLAYADGDIPAGADGPGESAVGWEHPPAVDNQHSYAALELAQAYLMTLDGVPMLYYGDEVGMTGAGDPDNRRDMTFDDKVSAEGKRVFKNFQKLGLLRNQHPALRYGSRRVVWAKQDLLVYARAHLSDRVLTIFNRGSGMECSLPVAPEFKDGDYADVLTGKTFKVEGGQMHAAIPARTALFVVSVQP